MKKTLLKDKTGNTLSPFVDMDSVLDGDGRALPKVLEENYASVSREIRRKADKSDIPSDFAVVTVETPYEEVERLHKARGFKIILNTLYDDEPQYFVLSACEQSEFVFTNIMWACLHEWRCTRRGWRGQNYLPEFQGNRVYSLLRDDSKYPSARAVYDAVQNRVMVVSPGDIMDYRTDDLSTLTSLIYVQDNARILPVTLGNTGWLYEWQEGWRIADVSGYTATNKRWYDFLVYMNGHSVPLEDYGGGSIDSRPVAEETATPLFPYVEYVEQTLTEEQKTQVRDNIGAAEETELTALRVDVGKDHTQLTNLQAKVNQVEQFTQVLDEDIATLQEDLEEIRADLTSETTRAKNAESSLQTQVNDMEDSIDGLTDKVNDLYDDYLNASSLL